MSRYGSFDDVATLWLCCVPVAGVLAVEVCCCVTVAGTHSVCTQAQPCAGGGAAGTLHIMWRVGPGEMSRTLRGERMLSAV